MALIWRNDNNRDNMGSENNKDRGKNVAAKNHELLEPLGPLHKDRERSSIRSTLESPERSRPPARAERSSAPLKERPSRSR